MNIVDIASILAFGVALPVIGNVAKLSKFSQQLIDAASA
jgi:hypothetical protein